MAVHTIRSGDTLSALAARYNTSVAKLAKLNKIANPNLIFAGKKLQIPGGAPRANSRDTFEAAGQTRRPSAQVRRPAAADNTRVNRGNEAGEARGATSKMRRLAQAGRAAALSIGGYTSRGLCATGVSRAIQRAFGFKVWGNGNQIDNNLPRGKFRQVNMSLAQALKTPGLVLTWERTSTRLGRIYGHTAITAGDGHTTYSDFIERNTLAGSRGRSGLKIFAPVA